MQFRFPGNQFLDNPQIVRAELAFDFFIRQYSAVQLPDSAAKSLPAQGYGVGKSSVKIKMAVLIISRTLHADNGRFKGKAVPE